MRCWGSLSVGGTIDASFGAHCDGANGDCDLKSDDSGAEIAEHETI